MTRALRLAGISLVVFGLIHPSEALAAKGGANDLDADGIEDALDNCVANPNGHQENTDSDDPAVGDQCDRDTINAALEVAGSKGKTPNAWQASTPFQRLLVDSDGSVSFSPEAGMFSPPNAGIGIEGADDSSVIRLNPISISGVSNQYKRAGSPSMKQSTWQSVTATDMFNARRRPNIPMFVASGVDGVGLGFEVSLDEIPTGQDLAIELALELPANLCLDASGLANGGGIGTATIRDCSGDGTPRVRLSAATVGTSGSLTILEDNGDTFKGLSQIENELKNDEEAPDDVGTNFYGGVDAGLVKTRYEFYENLADGTLGKTVISGSGPTYTVTLVADAAQLDRNRATSHGVFVGIGVTSLTEVDFGSGQTVYCRHMVGFGEVKVDGTDTTIKCENDFDTFDGQPTDYAGLFPFGGGTARIEKSAEQHQTGLAFGGSVVNFLGTTTIQFPNGGAGVLVGPGARVGPAGCDGLPASELINWADGSGSCAPGFGRRAWFSAESLIVDGSMGGLGCTEADCFVTLLKHRQMRDVNATSEAALKSGFGIGCAASRGSGFGVNPATGDIIADGPFDFGSCTTATVADGSCIPKPYEQPPGTGICSLVVGRVELIGLGSTDNPDMDLTIPSGPAISFAMTSGRGQIGAKAFKAATGRCEADPGAEDPESSRAVGYQIGLIAAGGANKTDLGVPLTAEDPNAVPPMAYCVDNIEWDEIEAGVSVGSNAKLELTRCAVREVSYGALTVLADSANNADPGLGCQELDGACRSPVQEFACPGCRKGGPHFMAVAGNGLTAPTDVLVRQCDLGLDDFGNVASGRSPTLQAMALSKGQDLVVAKTAIEDATGNPITDPVTVGGVAAAMLKSTVQIGLGADQKQNPDLVKVAILNSNLGLASENGSQLAVGIGNRNAPGSSQGNSVLEDNCFASDSADCAVGSDLLGSAEEDVEVQSLDGATQTTAASLPKPAGADLKTPFKCYTTVGSTPLPETTVTTSDPFFGHIGLQSTLLRTLDFCDPVSQNGDPVSDIFANLHCYEIREDATPDVDVEVSTDIGGVSTLTGVRAQALCLPATLPGDELAEAQAVLDAFKCYQRADLGGPDEKVALLEDAFWANSSRVKLDPFWVCNPVTLGGGAAPLAPEDHLACYKLSDAQGEPAFPGAIASVTDGVFGASTLELERSQFLCSRATAKKL